jgi:histidinol-phosphate aminotransferase
MRMGRASWFIRRLDELGKLRGYVKPERIDGGIRMDTNENLVIDKHLLKDILDTAVDTVDPRVYPEQYEEVREGIAGYLNVKKENIALGNGSDQLIDLVLSTLCRSTVTIKPTFTFYEDRCMLHSIYVKEVGLDDTLLFNPEDVIGSGTDSCYICSPNNPTGNQFPKDTMLDILDNFDGLIMVDEAYAEFADYTLCHEAIKRGNLIVFRTFSKAFALAGCRIGYIVASEDIVEPFNRVVQYPYAISSISLIAASLILTKVEYVKRSIEYIRAERDRVYNAINGMDGMKAFRSDANFILFTSTHDNLYERLKNKGIYVRSVGDVASYRSCVRASIGSRDTNDMLIDALKDIVKEG